MTVPDEVQLKILLKRHDVKAIKKIAEFYFKNTEYDTCKLHG